MTTILPQSSVMDWCKWLLRRRRLMRVTGRSMLPLLQPGDLIFVNPLAAQKQVGENDIVVAFHPQQFGLKIIKRVDAILTDGRYFLVSDNPLEGTDSRTFGALPRSTIVGVVTGYAIKVAQRSDR